jgi:hypothetical protein
MTERLIGQGSDLGLTNRTIEAGDRIRRRDAEEANKCFVDALQRYFKRGGRG